MLNMLAKLLLVATSLAPVLGAVAINQIALDKGWEDWVPWAAVAIGLALICWLILVLVATKGQVQKLQIAEFEQDDKEVVAFLLAYLLPFLSSNDMAFQGQWLTGAYVMLLLLIVFAHSGSLHFNPVMGLLGYHFYAVKDERGGPKLLISRAELHRTNETVRVACLTPSICLHLGEKRA
jgi:hypothetical protein